MQMKIVVSANGVDLDAPASPVFGRCPVYVFVDTETMAFEAVENPAVGAPGGAGIQAAQFVVERGAQAAVTGNMGPNAFNVLQSAGIPIYLFGGGTVRQAVEAFKAGQLQATDGDGTWHGPRYGDGTRYGTSGVGLCPSDTPPGCCDASCRFSG
jgi:predicted Fe-Mo cluster-binding NifX family protein